MNDHSPSPGTSQPGTLLLRTAGMCHLDMPHLVDVFGEQRQRFVSILQGFGPGDWAALEHPGFGGDSILPRCSCLGGPLSSTVPPPGGTTV